MTIGPQSDLIAMVEKDPKFIAAKAVFLEEASRAIARALVMLALEKVDPDLSALIKRAPARCKARLNPGVTRSDPQCLESEGHAGEHRDGKFRW